MSRMIECAKLHKTAEGLDRPPYPGELGERLYQSVSKEAWQAWQQHQIMLINEFRLNLLDDEAQAFLEREMEAFFFDGK